MKTFFVSSTFKDMHFERDAIREVTLPRLNTLAKEYGQTVSFCDLRWGIDTSDMDEEVSSGKVIRVCLDEIDRCKPPLVVILGERYGWIPDKSLIEGVAKYKNFELDDFEKSVTALEIEYGAISGERKYEHTLIYMRRLDNPPTDYQAEDEEHKAKLDELKRRVAALPNATVKEYDAHWNGKELLGAREFAEMLAEDLYDVMLPSWQKAANLTPFERERDVQWNYVEEKGEYFSGRDTLLDRFVADINSGKRLTFIKGATGTGKSTLFSALALRLRKEGWDVLPFIGGYTKESNDATDILRNTIKYLSLALGKPDSSANDDEAKSTEQLQGELSELCREYDAQEKKLIIMLDSVEKLFADEARDKLRFIPDNLSENLRFVLTAHESFESIGVEYETLSPLSREETLGVIHGILKRYSRELDGSVIRDLQNEAHADNPLYLSLLIKRLLMMNSDDFFKIRSAGDGMGAISKRQRELLRECPEDISGMCSALISEAAKRVNPSLIIPVLEYLSLSRYGLRERDLEALMGEKWSAVEFAHFLSYMNDFFIMRDDGRFDFTHVTIREGVLADCRDTEEKNREIWNHLLTLDDDDSVRRAEIIYHAIAAGEDEFVVKYIGERTDFSVINSPSALTDEVKTVYDLARSEGAQRICDIIRAAGNTAESVGFLMFTVSAIAQKFITRQEDIAIGMRISEEALDLAKRLESKNIPLAKEARLAVSITTLTARTAHDAKTYKGSIEKELLSSLKEAREIFEKKNDEISRDILATYLNSIASYYSALPSREKNLLAIEYLKQARALKGATDGAGKMQECAELAQLYLTLADKESVQTALALAKEAVRLAEGLPSRLAINAYHMLGMVYLTLGGKENIRIATELYEKAYLITKEAYSRSGEISDLNMLLNCRNNLIKALIDVAEADTLLRAKSEAEENVRVAQMLAEELGTVAALRPLILYLMNLAQIHQNLGGAENFAICISYLKRADEVASEIAKRVSTTGASLELAAQKIRIANIFAVTPSPENSKEVIRFAEESVAISGAVLVEEPDNIAAYSVMSTCYAIMAIALMNAPPESDNTYLPAILAAEAAVENALIYKDRGGAQSEHSLSTAYNNLALVYQSIYQNNIQLAEMYKERFGSEESLNQMILALSKTRPYEQISITDFDQSMLPEEESQDEPEQDDIDALLARLENADDPEELNAVLELMLGADKSNESNEVLEILDTARRCAIDYYEKALEALGNVSLEDGRVDMLNQVAIISQNIGALYLLGGEKAQPKKAIKMIKKASEIANKIHQTLGSLTSELTLMRTRIALINAYFSYELPDDLSETIEETLTLAEHLNSEWPTAETANNLIVLYNAYVALNQDDYPNALAIVEKLILLYEKIGAQNDNAIRSQYLDSLNNKISLMLYSEKYSSDELFNAAAEVFDRIKKYAKEDDVTELGALLDAAANVMTICDDAKRSICPAGLKYLEILKCGADTADHISLLIAMNDIDEPKEQADERTLLVFELITAIANHPIASNEAKEEYLSQGISTAKLTLAYAPDDDEYNDAVEESRTFLAFAKLKFHFLPGGEARYQEIYDSYDYGFSDDGDDEDDDDDTDGFDFDF